MIIKRGILEILNLDFLPDGLEKKEIMVEHSVSIKFELSDYVKLEKGDFIIHDEKKFSLNKDFIPVINKSTNGFIYDLKFYDITERFKDFKLKFQLGTVDELDFKLTTSGDKFLDIVIYSLHKHGLGTFTKGQFPSEIKEIHFKNVDIFSGLNQIANEYGLEWWIDGTILNLGKLEYGEPVLLRNDIELEDISFSPSSEKLITRLYAFGSSRNIPSNYRINEAVGDIAERRLRLPIGTEYVDLFHDLPENQVVEGVHVFEDIYPRQKNTIIDVLTNDFSGTVIYTFKGDNTFTITHDDIIAGKPLKIAFQSGLLAGKDFDLIIRDNNYFEIRYEQSGDVYLPNMTLKPQVGDEFFFFNFKAENVLPVLITQAENELLTQAQRFLDKIGSGYVYTTKNRSIHCEENGIDLDVGQVVTLLSETIGSVTSRIRGYEKNLYNKFECTLTVGDYSKYSRLKELGREIEKIADSPDHPDILNIYTTLREWSADGIISPTEKLAIKQTRQRIIVEHESVIASAEKYNLSVDDYQLAWDAYDQVLEKYSAEIPEHIPIEEDFGIAEESYKSEKIAIDNAIINAQKAEISSKQPSGSYLTWGEFDELFEINRNPITGEIESVGVHHPFYGKHEISAYGIGEVSDNDGGSLSLLSDVQLINPVQGQILRFNGTHWVNETLSVSTSWNDLADKPSTFAPSPHFHIVSDITNLQTVLDSKASISHDHDTLYSKVGHDHTVSDISDFPIAWAWSKLTGVPSAISGTTVSFTTSLKSKLDGIASGADVNVQADWNVTDYTSDAFIKNKPTSLPASDVYAWAKSTTKPTYSFSEIGSKPTTLIGYGIADAYTKTEVNSALASKLDKSIFDDLFIKVNKGTEAAPIWAIEAKYNFYSIGEVAAYGFGSDGGGGESYNRLDAWTDYNTDKSGWVLSALLGVDLNTRLSNIEGGSALTVNTTGTGNAITSISKAGTVITATKGATFSLDNHLHAGVYEPVFSKNTAFNKNFGTTAGTVAEGNHTHSYLPLSGGTLTGNLTAPSFIGSLTGNAASATKLQTARTIAGVSFDGTANIAIPFANLSSKPTTLAGYEITDAYTKTEVDTALDGKASLRTRSSMSDSFRRFVIGVIRLDGGANAYSRAFGTITMGRVNGLFPNKRFDFSIQKKYNVEAFEGNVFRYNSFDTFRLCKFLYNGVLYGGFDIYVGAANITSIDFIGQSPNWVVVEYYNTSSNTVINSEINNSLVAMNYEAGSFFANGDTIYSSGNLSPVTTNTVQTITAQKTFSDGDANYGINAKPSIILGGNNTTNAGAIKLWGNVADAYALIQTTTSGMHIDMSSSTGNIYIGNYTTGKIGLINNVGIGKIGTADYALDVNGSIFASRLVIGPANTNTISAGATQLYFNNDGATSLVVASTFIGSTTTNSGNMELGAINRLWKNVYANLYQSGTYNWTGKTAGFHSGTDGYQTGGFSIYNGTGTTANFYRLDNLLILGRAANQSLTIDTNSNVSILGNTTTNRIVLSSVAAEAQLEFSRPSYNYLTAPLNGGISFITNGDSLSALNSMLVLSPNGYVGVGKGFTNNTTAITAQLHVRGNILSTGEITAYVASDRRLKHNIAPLFSSLDIIDKLNPVSYYWNQKAKELNPMKSDSLDYGLIAQEVENVLPGVVHGIFDDKYKSIDYIKLIPIMIAAIKELKQKVNKINYHETVTIFPDSGTDPDRVQKRNNY